jgi:hypothetical protein
LSLAARILGGSETCGRQCGRREHQYTCKFGRHRIPP